MTYLTPAVEGEPEACPQTLFPNSVPLRSEEGEARTDGRLENTKEKPDCHGSSKVLDTGETAEDESPHDHIEGGPFGEWEALQQNACRPLPDQVAEVEHRPYPGVVAT